MDCSNCLDSLDLKAPSDNDVVFEALLDVLLEGTIQTREKDEIADECLAQLKWITQRMQDKCCERYTACSVYPFGSTVSGFGTGSSDLDAVVCHEGSFYHTDPVDLLCDMRRELRRHTQAWCIKCAILRARVPVLKLRYCDQLDVDLSAQNTDAVRNSRLLRTYSEMHESVRKLGVAIKLWAKGWNLVGGGLGHLSSYSFILMVIYFLQVALPDPLPCLQRHDPSWDCPILNEIGMGQQLADRTQHWRCSIGFIGLLSRFFAFYATDFGWGHEVVSIRLGSRNRPRSECFSQLNGLDTDRLHIEDPFDLPRNLCDVLTHWNEKELRQAIEIANTAMQAGQQVQVFAQITRAAAAQLHTDCLAVAKYSFNAIPTEQGYLQLKLGERIKVLYLGSEADVSESSWAFGESLADGRRGWLPRTALLCGPKEMENPSLIAIELPPESTSVARTSVAARGVGYVDLVAGEAVLIEYVGSAAEGDDGWAYGWAGGKRGWLPMSALSCAGEPDPEPHIGSMAVEEPHRFPSGRQPPSCEMSHVVQSDVKAREVWL